MAIERLDHCSIRTTRLADTQRFYEEVMGFSPGPRPPFPFPGVWLYKDGQALVHVVGVDPNDREGLKAYLGDRAGDDAAGATGTGTIDHIAFAATGVAEMRERLGRGGHAYRERTVPSLGLHQIFVDDPNGVTLELNYPAAEVADAAAPAATTPAAAG